MYYRDVVKEHNHRLNFCLLITLVLLLLCTACNGNQQATPTKPIDIAAETGKQISKGFLLTYETAKNLTENGTPAQKEFALTKLNPVVNQAKHAVAAFDRSVALWQRGSAGGNEVLTNKVELEKIYDNLCKLIIDAYALKEGA